MASDTTLPNPSPGTRRLPLLDAMHRLGASGVDCASCVGTCCTAEANSMQATPLEAYDVLTYLHAAGRLTKELATQLKQTVQSARLDVELNLPPGKDFRRTYTCPFFSGQRHGCSIPPESKPYGCLAFNPNIGGQSAGGDCSSNQQLLDERLRQAAASEHALVQSVSWLAKIDWDKKPLPVALLDVWRAAASSSHWGTHTCTP